MPGRVANEQADSLSKIDWDRQVDASPICPIEACIKPRHSTRSVVALVPIVPKARWIRVASLNQWPPSWYRPIKHVARPMAAKTLSSERKADLLSSNISRQILHDWGAELVPFAAAWVPKADADANLSMFFWQMSMAMSYLSNMMNKRATSVQVWAASSNVPLRSRLRAWLWAMSTNQDRNFERTRKFKASIPTPCWTRRTMCSLSESTEASAFSKHTFEMDSHMPESSARSLKAVAKLDSQLESIKRSNLHPGSSMAMKSS
mmetsp:Transcript_176664/g.566488  ORF Transcript_176664/g.566488 Transcript_176664/m.566488 type:complete len:262 (-) Transcript_176664:970-1755(-)